MALRKPYKPELSEKILYFASKSTIPRLLRFQKAIFSALENDPLFAHPRGSRLSVEKYQELNFLRCKRVFEYDFLPVGDMPGQHWRPPGNAAVRTPTRRWFSKGNKGQPISSFRGFF